MESKYKQNLKVCLFLLFGFSLVRVLSSSASLWFLSSGVISMISSFIGCYFVSWCFCLIGVSVHTCGFYCKFGGVKTNRIRISCLIWEKRGMRPKGSGFSPWCEIPWVVGRPGRGAWGWVWSASRRGWRGSWMWVSEGD